MLGKLPAKKDKRNLLVKDILKEAKIYPTSYNFDTKHKGIPTPMYGNDKHGCCVISGRAHQTLRFEFEEQNKVLPITDTEVLAEWRKENGNTENGLYMLDSLKLWRKSGWTAGGKKYKIKAFAQSDPKNPKEIKNIVYHDIGIQLGISMPDTWSSEFSAGKPWTDTSLPPNPYNGHCVFVCGYTPSYVTCVTWARKQKMSWEWFKKYVDEAYAAVDAVNIKAFDQAKIEEFLETVTPVEN
jgi:hypothetical protein